MNGRFKLSDGSLKPVWTKEQEDKYGKSKRNKTMAVGKILFAGEGVAPDKVTRPFFDVSLDSPEAEWLAEAPRHPVFRLRRR